MLRENNKKNPHSIHITVASLYIMPSMWGLALLQLRKSYLWHLTFAGAEVWGDITSHHTLSMQVSPLLRHLPDLY